MISLPEEIIYSILSYLSPRHLITTALVSWRWAQITRRILNKQVYIHSNRQYRQWLKTLEGYCQRYRHFVRDIVIHPQVHLNLADLQLLQLCPLVETFDIRISNLKEGPYEDSEQDAHINDRISQRHKYAALLQQWKYLVHLPAFGTPPYACTSISKLVSLVCSFQDITHSQPLLQKQVMFSNLLHLHLTFGYEDVTTTTLEWIHTLCPALEHLKLYVHSITSPSSTTSSTPFPSSTLTVTDKKLKRGDPATSLKHLKIHGLVLCDTDSYNYLLQKYQYLECLSLGFVFDEYYMGSAGDNLESEANTGIDMCAYLRGHRTCLFGLISGYQHLDQLHVQFQGANEYVKSIWPAKEMIDWMSEPTMTTTTTRVTEANGVNKYLMKARRQCKLRRLGLTYQRQITEDRDYDILGLDGILKSWIFRYQLDDIMLNVYNNDSVSKPAGQHQQVEMSDQPSFQHILDALCYSAIPVETLSTFLLTTLHLRCYPRFTLAINALLDTFPLLTTLDMSCADIVEGSQTLSSTNTHRLQRLTLRSSTLVNSSWLEMIHYRLTRLQALHLDEVTFRNELNVATETGICSTWDLSGCQLQRFWAKHISFKRKNKIGQFRYLQLQETATNTAGPIWFDAESAEGLYGSSRPHNVSLSQDTLSLATKNDEILRVKCSFVEDILFC